MAKVGFWLRGASGKFAGASLGKGQNGETIIRESVAPANPNTISQILQRMKLSPAQKYYKALSQLLSNAFEGVKYGEQSRQYFMSLCMKKEGGPYIPKGADRFIPADYAFTRGSLPSIAVAPFNGGATSFPLEVAYDGDAVTGDIFAQLLGVANTTQLTVCVVCNESGIFMPYYIPFSNRLMLKDVPEGTFTVTEGKVAVNPGALGLSTNNIVAFAIAISVQDSTGTWLRSTQDMVISNELRAQLYSPEAMETAIASYSDTKNVNSINSEWYYNLGINQAFNGQVTTLLANLPGGAYNVLCGVQNINGVIKYTIFADEATDEGKVVGVEGQKVVYLDDSGQPILVSEVKEYFAERGLQIDVMQITSSIIAQSGKDNGLNTGGLKKIYIYTEGTDRFIVDEERKLIPANDSTSQGLGFGSNGRITVVSLSGPAQTFGFSEVVNASGEGSNDGFNGTVSGSGYETYSITNGVATPEFTEYPG